MRSTQRAIPCSVLRGGTSKGLYFLASELPSDGATRDRVLLAVMGSPDAREIDGMGGGHPLTSKVAVIKKSIRSGIDVDYLFLQVWPDRAEVSERQNCGNILAGVAPFAIESGLIKPESDVTLVKIYMENTDSVATAEVQTPEGLVSYEGSAHIDGVPGTHAPIHLNFEDVAGSSCGALLPTGNAVDEIFGIEVTMIDNGMPVVCLNASDFGISGHESPEELEANENLTRKLEEIRLAAGVLMNLGDVKNQTVPKISLLSAPTDSGALNTRTFIPHRCHDAIGVLGAVSVATAAIIPGSVAAKYSGVTNLETAMDVEVEHPTGSFLVSMELDTSSPELRITKSAQLRTARMLMTGHVFVPQSIWSTE